MKRVPFEGTAITYFLGNILNEYSVHDQKKGYHSKDPKGLIEN